ncbi:MAG: Spy/CpxP family protein refolding chaperone [Blastocatellia bacterium]|nr:Spy/CpxP family protein refolding chaperone [Blastocatellia bacterium]
MKRFNKIHALIIASIMAIAVVIPVAFGQATGGNEGGKRHNRAGMRAFGRDRGAGLSGRFMKQLNLTDDQKAQLKQIHESHRESTLALRKELRAKRQEVRQATQGEFFDEATVQQKLSEAASIEARLMGEQFKVRQESLSVLTVEQKTQLDQLRQEFKSKMEERRAKGAGRKARRSQKSS